ncbi:hypothetical protein SAMN06298212_11239 [Ruaniaceae bacterium KH17]|nr:hypothetical protein SAMN06298212_11239 [Ruaniaceae bacterium KH17]
MSTFQRLKHRRENHLARNARVHLERRSTSRAERLHTLTEEARLNYLKLGMPPAR